MSLPHDWNRYEAAVENVAMSYIGNRRNDEDYPLRTIYMNDWKEMALSDEQKRSVGQLNGEGLHAVLVKLDDMAEKIKKTATHKKTNKCAEMAVMEASVYRAKVGLPPPRAQRSRRNSEASQAAMQNSRSGTPSEHPGSRGQPIVIEDNDSPVASRRNSLVASRRNSLAASHHTSPQASHHISPEAIQQPRHFNYNHYRDGLPGGTMREPLSIDEIIEQLDKHRKSLNYPKELQRHWHNQGHDQQDVPIHSHFNEQFNPAHYDRTQHALGKRRERRARCEPVARGRRERVQVLAS